MATARRAPPPDVASVRLRFGGGVNSRASPVDINPRECTTGQNFELQGGNNELRTRRPVEYLGTAPNGGEIRGFVNLVKNDGTTTALVQAGTKVYSWDGIAAFTEVATVSASARLRGPLAHGWPLDDVVIVTDLEKVEVVKTWNGSALSDISYLQSDGSTAFGSAVYAKYCIVDDERVWLGNVKAGADTPHLIVGCQRGSYSIISTSDRPSSSLADDDPFFLVQPDYRPINGFVSSFGQIITSSEFGDIFFLQGGSAQDFAFRGLYARAGARGTESVAATANDVVYGRVGRIESVRDTDRFGDVEANDLSLPIADQVEAYTSWTLAYNRRTQALYCFPSTGSEAYVYFDALRGSQVSPWSKYTTTADFGMQPTTVMSMVLPSDGLEYIVMGDASGNVFRMEGDGDGVTDGDVGGQIIRCERLSGVIQIPEGQDMFDIEGHISYRSTVDATVTLRFEMAGEAIFDQEIQIELAATTYNTPFGGAVYFGGEFFFGQPFEGRLRRRAFAVAGVGHQAQVRVIVESRQPIQIDEIFLEVSTAEPGA